VGFKSDTVAGVIIKTDSFMKRITSERKLYSFQDLFADSNIPAIQKISDES
jgi:hypothetical protein